VPTLRFDEEQFEPLGYVRGLHALLTAIDTAHLDGAILFMEGNPTRDVAELLAARSIAASVDVERGTIWPKQDLFHIPLVGTNLKELLELAELHAGPEICDHLVVYRDHEVLLWAHDAGDGYVLVGRTLEPGAISRLESALGPTLQRN
jgi:hypothetical protein